MEFDRILVPIDSSLVPVLVDVFQEACCIDDIIVGDFVSLFTIFNIKVCKSDCDIKKLKAMHPNVSITYNSKEKALVVKLK
jgi:hypothetical protein